MSAQRTERSSTAPRVRNARGEGARLREEIVAAATTLLQAGPAEAVTLRAIARTAGIAAPSIYRHFPDVDAILRAVVDEAFDELTAALRDGARGEDAVQRLFGVCRGYLDFAEAFPQRYRLMFGGAWNAAATDDEDELAERSRIGLATFAVLTDALQECVDSGASSSSDVFADTTALWVALHGLAGLRRTASLFPWPQGLDERLVTALARLG
ncbi:TetR/AcrR family transcriptional regulator [Kineococcus sp. SYSU DK005]|uniref:TetR/AcrR family transcriptional regulator n=1 Tax=Kineococcus sp. SYSU DK005 TaxID=3383126 RepID=UPI003D7F1052